MATWSSDEAWEEEGRFWLPGERDDLCYGKIAFTPVGGPVVHMMDSPLLPAHKNPIGNIPSMHGETLGGHALTLLDGIRTSGLQGSRGDSIIA